MLRRGKADLQKEAERETQGDIERNREVDTERINRRQMKSKQKGELKERMPCKKRARYVSMRKRTSSPFLPPQCVLLLGVVRSKVMTPLGDTVRFVNHKAFKEVTTVKVSQHGMEPR